jgi:hypothetical protein
MRNFSQQKLLLLLIIITIIVFLSHFRCNDFVMALAQSHYKKRITYSFKVFGGRG